MIRFNFLFFSLSFLFCFLVDPVYSAFQKEEKSSSELAIRDAIAVLNIKKLMAENKDDQVKINAAIEALTKLLPKEKEVNEKNNQALPDLNKLFSGKSSFNAKSKELSIYYDFKSKKQLDDFKIGAEKPQIGQGFLRVAGAENIRHIVNFKTVKITTTVFIESVPRERSPILGTDAGDNGVLTVSSRNCNINLDFKGTNGTKGVKNPRSNIVNILISSDSSDALTSKEYNTKKYLNSFVPEFQKTIIPISMSFTEKKVALKFGADDIAAPLEALLAGHVTLAGGQGGIKFGPLTISGVPENNWLEDLMK